MQTNSAKSKATVFKSLNRRIVKNCTLNIGDSQIKIVKQHETLRVFFSVHAMR